MYSKEIHKLIQFAKVIGWRVCIDTKLPVSGRCWYAARKIAINEADAKQALLTLLHELGHAVSYNRNRRIGYSITKLPKKKRETLAYLYGWALYTKICTPEVISKQDWRVLNYHVLEEVSE